jgi:hypothetical protein
MNVGHEFSSRAFCCEIEKRSTYEMADRREINLVCSITCLLHERSFWGQILPHARVPFIAIGLLAARA